MLEKVRNMNTPMVSKCFVSTGVSSASYLKTLMSDKPESGVSIYNCVTKEDISKIGVASHYDIIINYSDESVNDIVYDLFNYLIPMDVPLCVKVIPGDDAAAKSDVRYGTFLEKLSRHSFINIEYLTDEASREVTPEKNVVFFVGPGNTGKTSIISSVSELFRENSKKLALIDITRKNKLINYYPRHKFLNAGSLKENPLPRDFFESVNIYTDGCTDLYVYDYESDPKGPEVIHFCEILRKLSERYDHIFVNADESSVMNTPYIYKTANKIFIVHDFMPTKIRSTKKLLLRLITSGIDTQKAVSLIYNKTLKNTVDIGQLEEKLLFVRLPNKKIIPTVNLNCNTFEIPYERKTMEALVHNLATNSTGISETSKKYRLNITNIYKYINDIPYTENDEMEIRELLNNCVEGLCNGRYFKEYSRKLRQYCRNAKNSRLAVLGREYAGKYAEKCAGKLRSIKPPDHSIAKLRILLIRNYEWMYSRLLSIKFFQSNKQD